MLKNFDKANIVRGLIILALVWAIWNSGPESLLLRRVILFHLIKYALLCILIYKCLDSPMLLKFGCILAGILAVHDSLFWSHLLVLSPVVQGRFFIAGNLYNNEDILPIYMRELELFIRHVGEKNVFVSIVEDHSTDSTPILLQDWASVLDKAGVPNQILTSFPVPKKEELDRIERLAYLRNAALQPFFDPNSGFASNVQPGDKVIFINDILFFKQDLLVLADTTKEKGSVACSVDFGQHGLYDIWVTRDTKGREVEHFYPHFISLQDQGLWSKKLPVPVFSCWNGVVVMDAHLMAYFSNRLLVNQPFKSIPTFKPTHPSLPKLPSPTPGVRFRNSTQNECYSSESFLVWLDLRRKNKELSLYIHPKVIVAYSLPMYLVWKEFHSWEFVKYLSTQLLNRYRVLHKPMAHLDQGLYDCY